MEQQQEVCMLWRWEKEIFLPGNSCLHDYMYVPIMYLVMVS